MEFEHKKKQIIGSLSFLLICALKLRYRIETQNAMSHWTNWFRKILQLNALEIIVQRLILFFPVSVIENQTVLQFTIELSQSNVYCVL